MLPKKFLFYSFFLLGVSSLCCTEERDTLPPYKGEVTCSIDSMAWSGKIYLQDKDTVFEFTCTKMKLINNIEIQSEILRIENVRKDLVHQTIYMNINSDSRVEGSFNTVKDGSVYCAYYGVMPNDSLTNFIQLTHEKNNFKEVWGEFSVNFTLFSTCPENTYPNTLRIRDGNFHLIFLVTIY